MSEPKRRRVAAGASGDAAGPGAPADGAAGHVLGTSFRVPGLIATDHHLTVPLDYTGALPGTIKLFVRELVTPSNVRRSLPAILYLQGAPRGGGGRARALHAARRCGGARPGSAGRIRAPPPSRANPSPQPPARRPRLRGAAPQRGRRLDQGRRRELPGSPHGPPRHGAQHARQRAQPRPRGRAQGAGALPGLLQVGRVAGDGCSREE
jgi:hypothetical protein